MFRPQNVTCLFFWLSFLVFSSSVQADFLDLDYSLRLESHSQEADRTISDFIFNFHDEHQSESFESGIDLSTDLVYEHRSETDSTLWNGNLFANYHFSNSLSWIFNTDFSEVNRDADDEFDELNSQTITAATTGFEYVLRSVIRGEIHVNAYHRLYAYDESPLDASENYLQILYDYPLDQYTSLQTSYSLTEQEYDKVSQAINDTDNKVLRINLNRNFTNFTFDIYIESNDIEYQNQQSDNTTEAYGVNIIYQINSRSSLSFALAKDVQQSFELNTQLVDAENPFLLSGLLTNKRYTLQYDTASTAYNLTLRFYQYDIKDISDIGIIDGTQDGKLLDYRYRLNNQFDLGLYFNEITDDTRNNDIETLRASINYLISASRKYRSTLSLISEDRVENSIREDDVILQYLFEASLF